MAPGTIPEEEGLLGVEGIAALLNWTFVVSPSLGSEAASASWWYTSGVGFEWDDRKNVSNQRKHDVSFELAQLTFFDPLRRDQEMQFVDGEERWLSVGRLPTGQILMVVSVEREEQGERIIRLISARKADKLERRSYEGNS